MTTKSDTLTDVGYHVNVGAYVPLELKTALKELAHANRRTVSEEIRIALALHVSRISAEQSSLPPESVGGESNG